MHKADVILGTLRVSVLSPSLIRLEELGPQGFENRPTFLVVQREWPVPPYRVDIRPEATHVVTADCDVVVPHGATCVAQVTIREARDGAPLWRLEGDVPARPAWPDPARPGLSWAVADSPRVVPPKWGALPPPEDGLGADDPLREMSGWELANHATDVYVFVHRGDLAAWRHEFLRLTGPIPLPPLWAFGFWHSLYYPYTDREALETIDAYRANGYPLDVFVVDTDWRVGGSGGYDVEPKYFPDMGRFIQDAHARRARIVFNDHPQPNGMKPVEPAMLRFRRDGLTRFLELGLDAWWYDYNWVQIIDGPAEGIDKGVWGQKLYSDIASAFHPARRTMIMSMRSDHPASHRYPIWWTGDIPTTYEAMADGVRDTVSDGVRLMPYVNQDLGGHLGQPDDEQYVRWLQWGCLSPTMRVHGTRKDGLFRDPWRFGAEASAIIRDYVKLRYRLLPTLYAAARRTYDDGMPLLRKLNLEWPGHEEAQTDHQYLFGDDLLVAPVHVAADNGSGAARAVWIPPGHWENLWTGEIVAGPCALTVACQLHEMPLFVRRGGILLLAPDMLHTGEKPWDPIAAEVFAPDAGQVVRELYEDDGESVGYQRGHFRRTILRASATAGSVTVGIGMGEGRLGERPRTWRVRVHLRPDQQAAACRVNGRDHAFGTLPPRPDGDDRMVLTGWGDAPRSNAGPVIEVEVHGVGPWEIAVTV